MRSPQYADARLVVVKGQDLPLSGPALLELMQAVLARGVPFRFRARGWSMSPFIRDGDVITVSPLLAVAPRVGEVVAFVRPQEGNLVVHRVVAQRGAASYIRGDSLSDCTDGLVAQQYLLGRVTCIERNGRRVWLGLGPERYLIAWLSRTGLLVPLGARVARWLKPLRR